MAGVIVKSSMHKRWGHGRLWGHSFGGHGGQDLDVLPRQMIFAVTMSCTINLIIHHQKFVVNPNPMPVLYASCPKHRHAVSIA
jgi:hypothetical protein